MITRTQRTIAYLLIPCISVFLLPFLYARLRPSTNPMPARTSPDEVASALLAENGLQLHSLQTIQSLWAGYGEICRVLANPIGSQDAPKPYILKLVNPPPTKANDEGHSRKILSYQVEQYFYSHLALQLPATLPVAKCLASINKHNTDGTSMTAMLLSDLRQQYPVAGEKRNVLTTIQAHAALDWLSGFHGFWWCRVKSLDSSSLVLPPLEEVKRDGQDASNKSVWLNGGYTYLATRRKEYDSLAADYDSEWNEPLTDWVDGEDVSISEIAAAFLSPKAVGWTPIEGYQTLKKKKKKKNIS
jgi:hypothetical protein